MTYEKAYLLFPLCSALLYAIGSMALKTSCSLGSGNGRSAFVCNVSTALGFLFLYDWSQGVSIPNPLWPVLTLGVTFALGQAFTIMALSKGDVSSVTPVFGVKVILVGFLATTLLGTSFSALNWLAAGLAVVGIACLQADDRPEKTRRSSMLGVAYALLAALSFALFDILTKHWSPIMGFTRFVPPGMVVAAVLSYAFIPRKERNLRNLGRAAIGYLAIGATLFTLQAILLIRSIGVYGDVMGINTVYSTRGVWGVIVVWLIGRWFRNSELRSRQPRIVLTRAFGALLIAGATVLTFL